MIKIILLIISISLTGCKEKKPSKLLLQKWHIQYNQEKDSSISGVEFKKLQDSIAKVIATNYWIHFSENETFALSMPKKDEYLQLFSGSFITASGKYLLTPDGKKLTLVLEDGEILNFDIHKLNKRNLVMQVSGNKDYEILNFSHN